MYDVAIVGYGPTGMLAAILLARAGRSVALVERYTKLYNLPRVGIVHDDVLRMFQEIGIAEAVRPATFFLPSYEMAHHGRILLSNQVAPLATHGWPEMTSIYQPAFESELDRVVRAMSSIDLLQGYTAVALEQDADSVTLTTERADGTRRDIQARYLIGSDGGNSFVRGALGIGYEDLGFDQDWLVIDGKSKRPQRPDLPHLRQFCEPEQPGMTMRMGPDHRRWSFMIFPHEAPREAMRPENVWKRLARPEGGTPDEFELVRVASYKFQSLIVSRWREGRVFLAGDAAHQMPPFLAQGLCSGFRDAHNLAWKLDLVLAGVATSALLDDYEGERAPNSRATIIESVRVGQNVNERDPEKVRARDAQLAALQDQLDAARDRSLIAFRVPGLEAGFIAAGRPGAGDAFPQARVRNDGREGLFDDICGHGFTIVARNGDPLEALRTEDRVLWAKLCGRVVQFGAGTDDLDGRYGGLMDAYGCDIIVKRPDYTIFGACASARELPALFADLRGQLAA